VTIVAQTPRKLQKALNRQLAMARLGKAFTDLAEAYDQAIAIGLLPAYAGPVPAVVARQVRTARRRVFIGVHVQEATQWERDYYGLPSEAVMNDMAEVLS
jgi:hypothetical protein